MQIPILIEPIEGGCFRAREPFGLSAEGQSAGSAVLALEKLMRERLEAGFFLTFFEPGRTNSLAPPHAVQSPLSPEHEEFFQAMEEAIAENRRREAEEERLKDEPISS